MRDPITKFEAAILQPIGIALVGGTVLLAPSAMWLLCTRIGGLVGVMIAEILFKGLDWDWYPAMVVGLIALPVVRAGLKSIFCSAGLPSSKAGIETIR